MSSTDKIKEPGFSNVSELLLSVDGELDALDREAFARLHRRDSEGYRQALQERAARVAGLPELLQEYQAGGGNVPEEVSVRADEYAFLAHEAMESSSGNIVGFSLSQLLTPNDPDAPAPLQQLAARYAPEAPGPTPPAP